MKIALCYSGIPLEMEILKKIFKNHKQALAGVEVDIFAYFWEANKWWFADSKSWILNNLECKKIFFDKLDNQKFKDEANAAGLEFVPDDSINPNWFNHLSHPMTFDHTPSESELKRGRVRGQRVDKVFEDDILKSFPDAKDDVEASRGVGWVDDFAEPFRALSMFCGVEKSINLALQYERDYSFKYDFIFRMRPDLFFLLDTVDELGKYDGSKLNVSLHPTHLELCQADLCGRRDSGVSRDNSQISDWFAFGSGEVMGKYCDVYSNYKNLIKTRSPVGQEDLLSTNIKNNGVEVSQNLWEVLITREGDWHYLEDGNLTRFIKHRGPCVFEKHLGAWRQVLSH